MPTTVQLRLPTPHPAQAQIIRESKRFNVLACGRRFGKTTLGQDRLIHPALKGDPVAWFSPTYRQLSDAWRSLQSTLQPITVRKSDSEHRLELRGGGVIEAWSLDNPDSGRGRAYKAVVIDEAACVVDLEHAWQESIRPMLTDYRGDAWFLSTPKGTANYFHTLYRKGQGLLKGEWRSWQLTTAANPFIAREEIASAKEDMTDLAFAQEYMAQFVAWQGAVFRKILDAVAESTKGKAFVIGVDWGRVNDYTVFCVLSDAGELLELDRFRGVEYSLQRGRLQALYQRHGKPSIYAEANNMGGPVIEQLARDGLKVKPFITTNASKAEAIEALALAFERGTISIPNDPVLIGELQSFEAKPLASGLMRYEAPSGGHDDTVMALAIAWQGVAGRKRTQFDAEFMQSLAAANQELAGYRSGGEGALLPHDYPMGGNARRWSRRWN
jgi:phage FluMu gp28-like protein